MPRFIVAPRAKQDLRNIARYTQRHWGRAQRNKYLLGFEQRFQWLADNSSMGTNRPEIAEGYLSFPHERHTVFYTIADNRDINIIGVVGAGQSLEKYFN